MLKKIVFGLMAVSLTIIFGQGVSAQTASSTLDVKKTVKDLKKSLSKNSRFGSEVVYWFNPIDFEGCRISFRFSRLGENSLENFSNVYFDKSTGVNRNDSVRGRDYLITPTQVSQNQAQNNVNNANLRLSDVNGQPSTFNYNTSPYAFYGISNRIFLMSTFVTGFDLSVIDVNKIRLEKNEKGQYFVVVEGLKDKNAIIKGSINDASQVKQVESDIIPVTGEKSGNKTTEKLIEAVKACQQ